MKLSISSYGAGYLKHPKKPKSNSKRGSGETILYILQVIILGGNSGGGGNGGRSSKSSGGGGSGDAGQPGEVVREANTANEFAGMSSKEIKAEVAQAKREWQQASQELVNKVHTGKVDAAEANRLIADSKAKRLAYESLRTKANPVAKKAETAASAAYKERQVASRAKQEARYDKLSKQIEAHQKSAPFKGEIKGGNVQMNVVGSWRQSSRGRAWNAKDDKLMKEFSDLKRKLGK